MGLLEDKKTAAAIIIRKMGGSESYDDMKSSNEEMKQVATRDGAETDSSIGLQSACEEMMRAVEMKDASKFKMALESYLEMREDMKEVDND
jgi:hypothetical protein